MDSGIFFHTLVTINSQLYKKRMLIVNSVAILVFFKPNLAYFPIV